MNLTVVMVAALQSGQSTAQPPTIDLTQVGSPIWRPGDFQLFTAPADTDEQGFAVTNAMLPLEGPGATTYTPHAPPYDTELTTNAAAAGFVSRSVFPREAITGNPNGIYFHIMLLPDPGITGSSRDFVSGPVIPNSLFPFSNRTEIWQNGALGAILNDGILILRAGDVPVEGTSHRAPSQSLWNRGANPLGNYEFHWSLRDTQGNGWDIVAPFQVVDELPAGDFNQDGTVDSADYVVWRKTDGTQTGYDAWRANFGTSLLAGSGSAEPLSAVPEPSALLVACLGAIGIGLAMRRTTRKEGLPRCNG